MKYYITLILYSITLSLSYAQLCVTLKYKKAKCGGHKNLDTTSYFLLANKKWIIQYPSKKIDTIYTNINGQIKIPNKKGTYYLFEPWKYYKHTPDFPIQLYDKNCLQTMWQTPDFTIIVHSNKKYSIVPLFLNTFCPDKHPCLRKDTIIPRIPQH